MSERYSSGGVVVGGNSDMPRCVGGDYVTYLRCPFCGGHERVYPVLKDGSKRCSNPKCGKIIPAEKVNLARKQIF